MKIILLIAAFAAGLVLHGANLIPNGDLQDPRGKRPHVRFFKGKGKFVFERNGLLLKDVSPDGVIELNYYQLKMTSLAGGKRYYVRVPFEVFGIGSEKLHRASARVFFWDRDGKILKNGEKPRVVFSPAVPVNDTGNYEIFFPFIMPREAIRITFSFTFAGISSFRVNRFLCSDQFPVDSTDGNLILNGSLETPTLASFYFRGLEKSPLRSLERSTEKAKTGRWSLRSICENPAKGTEINFNMLPFTPGKKYRFSMAYFIVSRESGNRIAGRVTFRDAVGKVIRNIFPEGKSSPGEWHDFTFSFFPPPDCARVTVTIWIQGRQTAYLDDFYYGIIEEKTSVNRSAAAMKLSDSGDCTIWKEAGYLKVPPKGIPRGIRDGRTVELAAAANETEPFQLVVSAKKTLSGVTLAFSPLKGKGGMIPAKAITFRRVGFINIKNPNNPALKGLNADPIFPETVAAADPALNLPFYVTVAVPPKTPAGIYEGSFRVLSGKRELGVFSLKLRVFDFELPEIPNLKTFFYTMPFPNYNQFDKRAYGDKVENFHRLLRDHRLTGNQALVPPPPRIEIKDGRLTVTDWSRFDADVSRRSKVYGQRHFCIPYLGMRGDNAGWFLPGGRRGDKPGRSAFGNFNLISPEGLKYAGQFAAAFSRHVEEKFPELAFYAYTYDEPPAKVQADLSKLNNAIHAAAPRLRILVPKKVTDKIGYVHTFAVPFGPGYCNPELEAAHMKKGGDIWYYNWSVRLSSHDYIDNRIYAWKIYTARGNGGLLWNTIWTRKGINPWTDLEKTFNSFCGCATIFYPPRKEEEGNIPSQRAALIREGIDDFDYLRILEQLIDARYPGIGRVRTMEIVREIIPNPPFGYVNDPHLLYKVRLRLADEIESFRKFPAVSISIPADNSRTDVAAVKFKVFAPDGTEVKINGKAAGKVIGKKPLEYSFILEKTGLNQVRIKLTANAGTCTMERCYELSADPRLKELAGLISKVSDGPETQSAAAFLARVGKGIPYTEKDRAMAAVLTGKLKYAVASRALKADRHFVNPLEKFFFTRAREVFNWKLFERSGYYIALANEAAKAGNMDRFQVRVTPATFKNHPAFRLDNGIIQATILEAGGTLVSFKIKGVETLVSGSFSRILSPEKRAAQKVGKDMITWLAGYNGFTDAGGDGIWPVAYADWNVSIRELSADRAALTFSIRLPDTSFLLKRTMSMKAGSSDLVMDYEITNLMAPEIASDDPEHHQLTWRGRFLPGIGPGALPQLNDQLVIPTKYPRGKLKENCFLASRPVSYEQKSIRLGKPVIGVFDTKLHKGLAVIGGPVTTHAYVWFSSKGDHRGGNKIYTMEFVRSFNGNRPDDPEPNAPLTIPPGKSLNFSIRLRGLDYVENEADLIRQSGL